MECGEWAMCAYHAGLRGLALRRGLESPWHPARQCWIGSAGDHLGWCRQDVAQSATRPSLERVWGGMEPGWPLACQQWMGQCRPGVGHDHGIRSEDVAGSRPRRYLLLWRGVESRWNVFGQWE